MTIQRLFSGCVGPKRRLRPSLQSLCGTMSSIHTIREGSRWLSFKRCCFSPWRRWPPGPRSMWANRSPKPACPSDRYDVQYTYHPGGKPMAVFQTLLLFTLASVAAWAQVNVGEQKPEAGLPFTLTTVATFKLPWRLAFLPDGRMLVTEKVGPIWLVTQQGEKIQVGNTDRKSTRLNSSHLGISYAVFCLK